MWTALMTLAALIGACSSVPVSSRDDGPPAGARPAVILTGDFPDPTVVRDGNSYCMTHSSFDRPRVLHALASDHNYEAEVAIDMDGSPEVGFVLYYGPDAFGGIGYLDGQAALIKGGRSFLRDAAPCAGCRRFKIRMFEHDVALYFSEDGSNWIQHPRGLEVSGFQTNSLGGFSSVKLGVYAKGSGSVRVEDFRHRAIE